MIVCLPGLPLSLEPARRSCNRNRLIHYPFTDSEVLIDPAVYVFVLGEGFFLETGSAVPEHGSC
jgi:hypothetical protein